MREHGISSGFRRPVVDYRTSAAGLCAATTRWQTVLSGSRGADALQELAKQ